MSIFSEWRKRRAYRKFWRGLEQDGIADKIAACSVPREDVASLYYELLFAVASKFPGETRHQTALRYIRQAEACHGSADQSASKESK